MAAQWNVVKLYDEWRIVDVCWASVCILPNNNQLNPTKAVHMVNEFYFLTDPDVFIGTHFPNNSKWQLLPQPISKSRFFNLPKLGDRYFKLGLKLSGESLLSYKVQTVDGTLAIPFDIPKENATHLRFKYIIYDPKVKDSRHAMERYVLYQKTFHNIEYFIRFPKRSEYIMDIYGIDKWHRYYDLVCSYLINCSSPYKNVDPLPECPAIGWGPKCVEAVNMGLIPTFNKSTHISLEVSIANPLLI